MGRNDLIEPFAAQEIFVDGFTDHATRNGVMTCVGYRRLPEGNVIVVRLVWPAVNTTAAIDSAMQAMSAPQETNRIESGGNAKRKVH